MFGTNWAHNKWKTMNTVTAAASICFVHTVGSEMSGPNQAVKVKAVFFGRRQ
jgi:hypothetical protein